MSYFNFIENQFKTMQRIVFINLHANEFLVKTLNKYIWKQSCAFKHKYLLDYLLNRPDIEVCNYINGDGFTLAYSLPDFIMRILRKFRFLENRMVLKLNKIPRSKITVIKKPADIRPDDIVIGYRHIGCSLTDMHSIKAFKAISMIHFHGEKSDSESIRKANPDILFNECNLSCTSEIFRRYYSWYKKDFIVHPFVAASRFINSKPFGKRQNKCFSTGTITYKVHSEFLEVYGDSCDQPTRKQIMDNAEDIKDFCDCFNSDYLEDANLKKYLPSDNFFKHYYKVWYNLTHAGHQKKYFSFNMVEKFNDYKMCLIGEEILGVPGIGFVEGMACGCAYIGQKERYYEDLGMIEGVHYIGYDGSLEDLKAKISYYQQPEHQEELERIANAGYEFAKNHFKGDIVAKGLIQNLTKAQEMWLESKKI